jgi:hypothetical protein
VNVTRQDELLGDIHDSPKTRKKMKSETVIIDLPDVSDIPGQEHIVVPLLAKWLIPPFLPTTKKD